MKVTSRLGDTDRHKQKLIRELRRRFGLGAGVSDDEVLQLTEGTLTRAFVELGVELRQLGRAILGAFWRAT